MSAAREIVTRTIRIRIVQHRKSDLLVALSDDLKGLMVPGRSELELEQKLPEAVREILEAQGNRVISVVTTREARHLPSAFIDRDYVANAQLEIMH